MTDLATLAGHLRSYGRVLLGYSGGVDSSLLAVAARRALDDGDFVAAIGRSASYPDVQYRQALDLAAQFDIPLLEVDTGEMADPRYLANAPSRCYFCKTELWTRLGEVAVEQRFDVVIDGTNASDLGDHRPGLRAAQERRVRSPLAELGWTKADVRTAARDLGIPIWDAPAAPCLSSRIRYGVRVTPERLAQVEQAEALVRAAGVRGNLRVRHLGDSARVEVDSGEVAMLRDLWSELEPELLTLGFGAVTLDPAGYRRGALLELAGQGQA
ncbi:MAG TPA: ATP-dependent sacrificial sulfur transferase LarE [Gemmatimonadales bacterium]|nr:ATP-dependent sacrificial sulfur transferase LarE [Gemmatimonadales bacterium]